MEAELLTTINRLYECQLAKLELQALGGEDVAFDLDGLRFSFEIGESRKEVLGRRGSWFKRIGGEETLITRIIEANKPVLHSHADLWFSHFAYPFKARFRPMLARSLLNIVNPEGEGLVLDGFVGSGTTLIEASLLGLESAGVDVNPFFTYMSQAKLRFFTRRLEPEEEAEEIWASLSSSGPITDAFHPLNYVIYSYATQTRVGSNPEKAFLRRFGQMKTLQRGWLKIKPSFRLARAEAVTGRAEELPYPDEHFTAAVTSPPYSDAVDYLSQNRGAPEFFPTTRELKEVYKTTRELGRWKEMIDSAIAETLRVLKPGRRIAFIVGNQRKNGKVVPMVDWCIQRFKENGCMLLHRIPQLITSRGTLNISVDEILILKKGSYSLSISPIRESALLPFPVMEYLLLGGLPMITSLLTRPAFSSSTSLSDRVLELTIGFSVVRAFMSSWNPRGPESNFTSISLAHFLESFSKTVIF